MPDRNWPECGGLRLSAAETLTALVGLEVLFKALAATEAGHDALRTALDQRLAEMSAMADCGGVDAGAHRLVASQLRDMVDRAAPVAVLAA